MEKLEKVLMETINVMCDGGFEHFIYDKTYDGCSLKFYDKKRNVVWITIGFSHIKVEASWSHQQMYFYDRDSFPQTLKKLIK